MERASAPGHGVSSRRVASAIRRQRALATLARRALGGATLPDLAADAVAAVADVLSSPLVAVASFPADGAEPDILAEHGVGARSDDGSWFALTRVAAGGANAPAAVTDTGGVAARAAATDADVLGRIRAFRGMPTVAAAIEFDRQPVAILAAGWPDRVASPAAARSFIRGIAEILALALARASDENELQAAHHARFQGLIDSDANGLLMVDERGRIVEANRRAADLFGYEPGELVGAPIERFVPDRVRPIHAHHRATYAQAPSTRPMGVGRDLTARRKDGTEFPVEIGLSSFEVGGRRLVTAIVADITSRKTAETALAESERRFRTVLEASPNAILGVDASGRIGYVNPQVERTFGYAPSELVGRPIEMLLPERVRPRHVAHRQDFLRHPNARPMGIGLDLAGRRKDGTEFPVEISLSPVSVADRLFVFATVVDITARKSLEEQLLQAQKMESVGRLAGGVAHDFNNILTTISGYSQLLLGELAEPQRDLDQEDLVRNIGFIRDASSRAASLTQQLLAFSRRQVLRPHIIDLNRTVAGIEPMLRPLLGERIEIVHALDPAVGRIRADPGQLDQIIVNLAANARDAMPDGGTLTIETSNATFDEGYAIEHFDVTAGNYVVLAVSDTGTGMDRETRAHVFEPFYTTKEVGKGTGLGLATIYGIVRQSGGHIWLYSEPGQGTTFKIYLPRTDEAVQQSRAMPAPSDPGRRRGTVLLVEDDDSVRQYARIVLARAGYDVLEASDGVTALELVAERGEPLAALVTDVIMPHMTGPQLVDRLAERVPVPPVVYVSGYTSEAVDAQGMLGSSAVFLTKPFSSESLHAKLAEAFQSQAAGVVGAAPGEA